MAELIENGLILRRDSANGKRFRRRCLENRDRTLHAFGFDLSPLVLRAAELRTLSQETKKERASISRLWERLGAQRRFLQQQIDTAIVAGCDGTWLTYKAALKALPPLASVKRDAKALDQLNSALRDLASDIDTALKTVVKLDEVTGNDGPDGRQNQTTESGLLESSAIAQSQNEQHALSVSAQTIPPITLDDLYARFPNVVGFVAQSLTWPLFIQTTCALCASLSQSDRVWQRLEHALGSSGAALVLGCVVERLSLITSQNTTNDRTTIRNPRAYLNYLAGAAAAGRLDVKRLLGSRMHQPKL
jgi:replication initiation protein RepC